MSKLLIIAATVEAIRLPATSSRTLAREVSSSLSHTLLKSCSISYVDLNSVALFIISTLARARISPLNADVEDASPSTSSPAASRSVFVPRKRIERVFNAVPTISASCTIVCAAVYKPTDCSIVLPASYKADAERFIASPMSPDVVAKELPTSLNRSIIPQASLILSSLNAFIVETRLLAASSILSIESPTFL